MFEPLKFDCNTAVSFMNALNINFVFYFFHYLFIEFTVSYYHVHDRVA